MRTLPYLITLSLTMALGAPALAQSHDRAPSRAGASYPRPAIDTTSPTMVRPEVTTRTVGTGPVRRDRWGSKIGGRWWGGANAPGGWPAYRPPARGVVMPGYWNSPRFAIDDWATYHLPQPPAGYRWSRYYDDAVLIDPRGTVYDSVYGLDWDGLGVPAYAGGGYPPPPPVRRDTGLGGAVIGAVAGGVAGNVIAGRDDRLGGTLIGAGVGAAAGYAIDRAEDRRARMAPGYDDYGEADYGRPDYGYPGHYPPPPPPPPATGGRWVTQNGTTVTTTTAVGTLAPGNPGYYDGGYYYPAPTVTTIVVQGPPVTTTTTTTTTETVRTSPRRARVRSKSVRR
ncbi:rickettsia 17 kDa surface antigen family protein [Sphingomonas sp. S17]|uniref:17 kDa surface antigen n=1 Tax=Sphingomonas paucimobilis NBRC 13935 TaxID=1219050 RepID=A0A0C9LZR4_SPHPI|nr:MULTISPECIES: RcnB family protein [Sphingomonas]EGI54965.1 rickettsia 17 kDa surface antigen family protein [Sphingomonas sp. S17]MCM3678064.1 RcnB family protein [Sphingomonas paucimobilis]MDG5972697.1 RcnB family protein [Sphingomonas paucimobilis]BCI70598.1 hypothetical protein SPKIRA_14280 [Sphingomonas paucimobilis]GAN12260.1 hypothetical protein SP6_07_00460 [Sphingomonas paucimobilis NBRC 13935]